MGLDIFRDSEEYNKRNDEDINTDILVSNLRQTEIATENNSNDITNPRLWNIDLY